MSSAKRVNVPYNGACYYHAVYKSLKTQNLLVRVCEIFNFPKSETAFIQAVKQFILSDNFEEYKRQYADFFDRVCSMIQRRNTDLHDVHMTPDEYDYMLSQIIDPLPRSLMELLVKHIKNKAQEKRATERNTIIENGKATGLSEKKIFHTLTEMKLIDNEDLRKKFRFRNYQEQQRHTACANFEAFFKDVCLNLPDNSYWATWIETDFVKIGILEPCGIKINVFTKESRNLTWDKSKKPPEPTLHYLYDENSIYLYNDFSHYQYFDFNLAKKTTDKEPFQVIVLDDEQEPVQPVQPPKPAKKVNPNLYPCPYMCKNGPCKNRSIEPGRCGTHRFMIN